MGLATATGQGGPDSHVEQEGFQGYQEGSASGWLVNPESPWIDLHFLGTGPCSNAKIPRRINSLNSYLWFTHAWAWALWPSWRMVLGNWNGLRIWGGRRVGNTESLEKDNLHWLFSCVEAQPCLSFTFSPVLFPFPGTPQPKSELKGKSLGKWEKGRAHNRKLPLPQYLVPQGYWSLWKGRDRRVPDPHDCSAKYQSSKSVRYQENQQEKGPTEWGLYLHLTGALVLTFLLWANLIFESGTYFKLIIYHYLKRR